MFPGNLLKSKQDIHNARIPCLGEWMQVMYSLHDGTLWGILFHAGSRLPTSHAVHYIVVRLIITIQHCDVLLYMFIIIC